MVVSMMALFIAIGGSAIAATLAANSVKSKHIKDNAVKSKDIKDLGVATGDLADNSVTGTKIVDATVDTADLADNAVNSAKVAADSLTADDLANNSVDSPEIAANAVAASEIENNSIDSGEIVNNGLNAVDVSTTTGAEAINFGAIAANDCATDTIDTNVNLENDVLMVSADDNTTFANGGLTIHATHSNVVDFIRVNVCNVTGGAIDPAAASFQYIAFRR
jgi:hypothetical protein